MKKPATLIILLCLLSTGSFSQITYKQALDIPLSENGNSFDFAFCGGFNTPQFSVIDLDQDGVKDLFVFDRSSRKTLTFLNAGTPGSISYAYAPVYTGKFPSLSDWVLLRDYNGDGKEDIFTSRPGGIRVYKNTSDPANGLRFELAEEEIEANYGSFTTNIFVSSADLPAILDVDGDGDIDILNFELGPFSGDAIYYYKNLSKETYNTADSFNYKVEKRCWGRFRESPDNCTVFLNDTNGACKTGNMFSDVFTEEEFKNIMLDRQERSNLHAGSTVLALDADGNTTLDLLIGDISCSTMYLVSNDGNNLNAHMVSVTNNFPVSKPVDIPVFPGAFHLDVNNDGLRDLIVAPNILNAADNYHATWLYLNTGTASAPVFTYQSDDFLENEMLDLGEGAYPHIFDHNNDGKPDILVGNRGYYNGTGNFLASLALLENTGTAANPSFSVVSRNYMNTQSYNLSALSPATADLDNDGDADLLIGDIDGKLHFFTNTAPSGSSANFVLTTASYKNIDVGQFNDPCIADANKDGLPDLILGEKSANINYYENTGSAGAPDFTLRTDTLGKIKYIETNYISGYSSPVLIDADKDNQLELVVSQEDGTIYLYENIEGNLLGSFTKADSFLFNLGEKINIAMGDLNADSFPDLVVGSYGGGLAIFLAQDPDSAPHTNVGMSFQLYPNPAGNTFHIRYTFPGTATFELYDPLGRMIYSTSIESGAKVFIPDLKAGLYIARLNTSSGTVSQKLISTGTSK